MLPRAAFNAFAGRYAEEIARRLQWLTGNTAMNDWVPDEVHVHKRPHVVAVRLFHTPSFDAQLIECNYFRPFRLLGFGIVLKQVSQVLHYFVAELHSHALFR